MCRVSRAGLYTGKTSCFAKFFSSVTKGFFTDIQKRMPPIPFEAFLFLKLISQLWNLYTVPKVMKLDENAQCALDYDDFYQ